MRNLRVLFLSICFFYCFSVVATDSSSKVSSAVSKTEELNESDLETLKKERNVNMKDQTADLVLNPVAPVAYTERFIPSRFLEVGLEYPTSFGINLRYLLTDSVYVRFGLGFMSQFFLESFEKIADSFGYLNEEEAKLLSDTLKDSFYLDLRLAWAPYLKSEGGGPYLELGFSHSFFGKGKLKGITLSQVLGDDSFDGNKNYSAKANTYNANFHLGYQIPFEKVKLNFEIGLIKILHTELLDEKSVDFPELLSESQKKTFQDFLKTKGWIFPTFSGWISFAF